MTLQQAQAVADALRPGMTLEIKNHRVHLSWKDFRGETRRFRWDAPGGSHYPTWSNKFPSGGTITTAFDLLVRRLQGKPSVPMNTWRHMIDGPAKLADKNKEQLLAALAAAQWPESVPCVLCGKLIERTGDWWTVGEKRKRTSGPACSMHDCRENKPRPTPTKNNTPSAQLSVKFEHSHENLPPLILGPFGRVEMIGPILYAAPTGSEQAVEIAGRNQDDTWDARPKNPDEPQRHYNRFTVTT